MNKNTLYTLEVDYIFLFFFNCINFFFLLPAEKLNN